MDFIECPRCKRKTVHTVERGGTVEKTRCSSCGWTGPKCFGQRWDPNSPKCQGGADPTNWEGSTHVRPKCSFESRCSAAMDKNNKEQLIQPMNMLTKPKQQVEINTGGMQLPQQTSIQPPAQTVAQARAVPPRQTIVQPEPARNVSVSVTQGHRPQYQQPQPQYRQAQYQQQYQQPRQQMLQPQQQQMPVQAPSMGTPMAWVPPQQAQQPMYVPQNYPQPGMQVPAYLTAPEPVEQGIVPMFFNSMARAAFKGAFHTAANLMDHVPWGGYPAPPPGPPGDGTG